MNAKLVGPMIEELEKRVRCVREGDQTGWGEELSLRRFMECEVRPTMWNLRMIVDHCTEGGPDDDPEARALAKRLEPVIKEAESLVRH
jgi:hypothetical protein